MSKCLQWWVLGTGLSSPIHLPHPINIVMAVMHPQTTLQADVHRWGAGAVVVSPTPSPLAPSVITPPHCLPHLMVGVGGTGPLPVVPMHPPLIHPASSFSQQWWCCWWGWRLLWAWWCMLCCPPSLLYLGSGQCQVYLAGLPMSPLHGIVV